MHICFVAIDYHSQSGGGGIASYVSALGSALAEQGHQVTVLAKGNRRSISDENGIRTVIWPFSNFSWYWHRVRVLGQWPVLLLREIEWAFSINKAIACINDMQPLDLIEICETGSYFLKRTRIPYVMRLHGEPFVFRKHSGQKIDLGLRLSRRFEFSGLRSAAAVTSPSQVQADEVAHDIGWPSGRIRVIPNPVSSWMIEQASATDTAANDPHPPRVLYTGRIDLCKGPLLLLEAVDEVALEFPDVEFVIAGGRHNSINDETLNQVLDCKQRRVHVKMPGHVPWQSLPALYRQASVFVMPSYYETFSISCAEAMAFGLPVVATRTGGLPEVVEDDAVGVLVPVHDAGALGKAIVALLRDPERRAAMGRRGRQRVAERYTVQQVLEETLGVYKTLVHNNGP
jgi:glycosyltransferase involved in cell wall biosynthesis